MANSNFLPDIEVTLNDLGLSIAPPPAGTKVTFLGITSNTGVPLLEPLTVASLEKAVNTLWFSGLPGPKSTETVPGELSLAIEEAAAAGATNLEVVVIAHVSGSELLDWLSPLSGDPTKRYAALASGYDVLKNHDTDIVVPVNAYIDQRDPTDAYPFGKQLADACFQMTKEQNAAIGVIAAQPPIRWALNYAKSGNGFSGLADYSGSPVKDEVAALTGTNTDLRHTYFTLPSTKLVELWHDFRVNTLPFASNVAPSGELVVPDSYMNFLSGSYDDANNKFADAANSSTLNPAYFTSWQAKDADGNLAVDSRGVKVDAGAYINVVCASVRANSSQASSWSAALSGAISETSYVTDAAAAYAGLIASRAPHSATTNKAPAGIFPHRQLSRSQVNNFVGMRHVTFLNRSTGFVVAKDVTGAHNVNKYLRSDYVLLSTVRIVHAVVDLIRAVAEEFIGEPNNGPQLNALHNEIDQVLLSMKGTALNAYDFVILSTPEQRVLGEASISLTLVPAFEVTNIDLTVSLAKEL